MSYSLVLGQISFDDFFNRKEPPKPKFFNGQEIFIRKLDTIISGKVNRNWLCSNKNEEYYGYSVDLKDGTHTVVWDYLIGDEVFLNKESAINKAESLLFEKIDPIKLPLNECRSFEFYRTSDGYRLTATIAKLDETQLYEHSYMCYHFLKEYPNKKSRDKAYIKSLSNIIEHGKMYLAKELIIPELDVLYKVNETLYASRDYAKFNGVKSILKIKNGLH